MYICVFIFCPAVGSAFAVETMGMRKKGEGG
jgi:hypothetical protein